MAKELVNQLVNGVVFYRARYNISSLDIGVLQDVVGRGFDLRRRIRLMR